MKKILIIAIVLAAVLSTATLCCVAAHFTAKGVKGSNNLITRTIDAPAFTGIEARQAVKVVITDSTTDKITIEADDNLIDMLEIKADGETLKIGYKKAISNISNTHVTVTVPANGKIRSLDASSASSIVSQVGLQADDFAMETSSAAKIEATVKANTCSIETSSASKVAAQVTATSCKMEASSASKIVAQIVAKSCNVEASSAAKISLTGSSEKCSVDLGSASKLDASEFIVADYTLDTNSGSSASINCTRKLVASASSGSSIRYSGGCSDVTRNMSSGGSVRNN